MARKIGSRYTANQILGRGSAGTVWLGEGPDGPVAVKLLREDLASDQSSWGASCRNARRCSGSIIRMWSR